MYVEQIHYVCAYSKMRALLGVFGTQVWLDALVRYELLVLETSTNKKLRNSKVITLLLTIVIIYF